MMISLLSCNRSEEFKKNEILIKIENRLKDNGFVGQSKSERTLYMNKTIKEGRIKIVGDAGFHVALLVWINPTKNVPEASKKKIIEEYLGLLMEELEEPFQIKLPRKQSDCIAKAAINRLKKYDEEKTRGKMNLYINIGIGKINFDKYVIDMEEIYGGFKNLESITIDFKFGRYDLAFINQRIKEVSKFRAELLNEKRLHPSFSRMDELPILVNCVK